jgi:hypothetical protein
MDKRDSVQSVRGARPNAYALRGMAGMLSMGVIVCMALLAGCSLSQDQSKTPRTGIEQLLLSQALERSLAPLSLPLPDGATIMVDAVALSGDGAFARKVIENRLVRLGFRIPKDSADAAYQAHVVVQSFGTEQGETFFGIPPIQSMLFPISVPELAFYKNVHQQAMVRLSFDVHHAATGQYLTSTPWYEGMTFNNGYTWLLVFGSQRTDLLLPRGGDPLATKH